MSEIETFDSEYVEVSSDPTVDDVLQNMFVVVLDVAFPFFAKSSL